MNINRNRNTNKNIILTIIISIALYLIASYLFSKEDNNNFIYYEKYANLPDYSENVFWDPSWIGKVSNDCYELSKRDCMKYANCGLCRKDGKYQCIPGDNQGPLFKEGCDKWIHTNYRDRYIFKEKIVTESPPHDYRYLDYEAHYPSPQSRATL